jgi:hypothetical protein
MDRERILQPHQRAGAAARRVLEVLRDLLEPTSDFDRLAGREQELGLGHR